MIDKELETALENAELTPSEKFWVKIAEVIPVEEKDNEITDPELLKKRYTI